MTRPSFAPTIYHDGQSLFLEFAGSPGQTLRFPFTEGGLSKALRHIPNVTRQSGYLTPNGSNLAKALPKATIAKSTKSKREKARFSDAMREAAGVVIRKLKVGE